MIDDQLLYKTIGSKVRDLRENAAGGRKTQAELAELVGLERTSITNIEKGVQKVPLHVLYRICSVFDVPLNEVLPALEQIQQPTVEKPAFEQFAFGEQLIQTTPKVKELLHALLNTRGSND
ncbi:helix-turn-helix transcriptional regulator [Burkholderia pyrrocinia]|uniref:helix-turn-helix transcriptional regulator n=1 Tax=Burkholderia pyrrocinia TaxID=60550 RepID=UPI0014050BBC|nr:helix-turn-helix transcriptional regulator [Burkholderia pyrrocinia]